MNRFKLLLSIFVVVFEAPMLFSYNFRAKHDLFSHESDQFKNLSPYQPNFCQRIEVYSHGFGESGEPCYPDAPGKIFKACFYTQPAVHVLANHLMEKVNKADGNIAIDLHGRSCGAGTAINTLYKLSHYDPKYFAGTKIHSKKDAERILEAINKGSLHLDVPFLSLKKAKAISFLSSCLSMTSIGLGCGVAWCSGALDKLSNSIEKCPSILLNPLLLGVVTHFMFGPIIKNNWSNVMDLLLIPSVTNLNYNPFHIKPIDAAKGLKGKLQCPILIHVCKNDRVLDNSGRDIIDLYEAFYGDKTHIIISSDAWHNAVSQQHDAILKAFKHKYRIACLLARNDAAFNKTQPTVKELESMTSGVLR